jgi:hypothetical protein
MFKSIVKSIVKHTLVSTILLTMGMSVMAEDKVPILQKQLMKYKGLNESVTRYVLDNPNGRIHGHDATQILFSVSQDSKLVNIIFLLPASFRIHGHRVLICHLEKGVWHVKELNIQANHRAKMASSVADSMGLDI